MTLRAIVFDYGKVLSLAPTPEDWQRLADVFHTSSELLQRPYWALREDYDRGVYNGPSYWRTVAERLNTTISDQDIEFLIASDDRQWLVDNSEMLDFAWRAKEAGLKIAILSNMQSNMLFAMRKQLDWLNRFDAQVYSCEIAAIKPEPASYRAVLEKLGVAPQEAVFFDDKLPNIEGARAVGMHAELFEGKVADAYTCVEKLGVAIPSSTSKIASK